MKIVDDAKFYNPDSKLNQINYILVALLIKLAYLLNLRKIGNDFQRWLVERDAPQKPLPAFRSIREIEKYAQERFAWRKDKWRKVPLDWVSKPEVFQAMLESDKLSDDDGDCDDYHYWFAKAAQAVQPLSSVYLLSVGFGKSGHTVCVVETADENDELSLLLIDYTIKGTYSLDQQDRIPLNVAQAYLEDDEPDRITFVVWEEMKNPFKLYEAGRVR